MAIVLIKTLGEKKDTISLPSNSCYAMLCCNTIELIRLSIEYSTIISTTTFYCRAQSFKNGHLK